MLYIDIESVPQEKDFDSLNETWQNLWKKKVKRREEAPEEIYNEAGLYPEFGKIICISVGILVKNTIRIKSFYGEEKVLLDDFAEMLMRSSDTTLCGHNIKSFDNPFIAKRMLINNIPIPGTLSVMGKKPWEINHVDTMELWKFGDMKNMTSLDLLCNALNIPTPKDGISGADVYKVYYEDNDLESIVKYCEKDVLAVAKVYQRLTGGVEIKEVKNV